MSTTTRKTINQTLEKLRTVAPEERLRLIVDFIDELEAHLEDARDLRNGTVIDLRIPGLVDGNPRGALKWVDIVKLTGRELTPPAVQQWARQYTGPGS